LFAARIPAGTTRLAGAELGGIPLVSAASMASGLPCLFIRNQKKDYGTAKQLEGKLDCGDRVMIVEDVATTGGQALEAAKVLREGGAEVTAIVSVIDRMEGARENIQAAGIAFDSLFTVADLGITPDAATARA
jgi:orotate phosphoribosyltransferase